MWMCVGAAAGGLAGYFFAKHFDYEATYLKHLALNYEKQLTEEEVYAVQTLIEDQADAIEFYADHLEYVNHSISAQLDPDAVDTMELRFTLNGSEEALPVFEAAAEEYLISEDVMEEVVEKLNKPLYRKFIRELISIDCSADYTSMTVWIQGTDAEMCKSIGAVLKTVLERDPAEILESEAAGGVRVIYEGETITKQQSASVKEKQRIWREELEESRQEMQQMVQGLSERQRRYFYANIAGQKNVSGIFSENVDTGYYRLRYSVEGMVLFGMIAAAYVVIRIFFNAGKEKRTLIVENGDVK